MDFIKTACVVALLLTKSREKVQKGALGASTYQLKTFKNQFYERNSDLN